MLQVTALHKAYGPIKAVEGLSLHIAQGECYALLGPNGAGKTTTINVLSGLLKPDSGTLRIAGLDPLTQKRKTQSIIGVVPQEIALYEELSARQNLHFWAGLYGLSKEELKRKTNEALQRIGLLDRADHPMQSFSGGMKRRVNIAAAILHQPRILFMDEPTVGIDPQSRYHIYELIEELHAEGMTILYTTHYMEEAERLCDRIGIMDRGTLIAEGSLRELRAGVSGQSKISVECSAPIGQKAAGQLSLQFAHRIQVEAGSLVLQTDCIQQDISALMQLFAEHQLAIQHLEVSQSDLESVFLELTGRELRD